MKKISTGEPDSFAVEDLLSQAERVIGIIIDNNLLSDTQINDLLRLRNEIKNNSLIEKLKQGEDREEWNKILELEKNHTWLDDFHHGLRISYFHRLLLEKIEYFKTHKDPYMTLKQSALNNFINAISDKNIGNLDIDAILDGMLWGNKFDLVPPSISERKEIICDEREGLKGYFGSGTISQIDILADNAGQELFFDLLFACYVLDNKLTRKVNFHLKNYPYNVSDATKDDFLHLVETLVLSDIDELQKTGVKIKEHIQNRKINSISYPFTTLGYDRIDAINISKKFYQKSSLIITKGDFNYRKNIGWYYWGISDNFGEAISYLKSPLLSLRTVKNEILIGISDVTKVERMSIEDPEWWKKGIGGMISFQSPKTNGKLKYKEINQYWEKEK